MSLSPKTLAAIEAGPLLLDPSGFTTEESLTEFATRIALIEREEVARECADMCLNNDCIAPFMADGRNVMRKAILARFGLK